MLRTLIIAGCAAVVAVAVGTPRPASASPPPYVYGERGAGHVESNLYRKRHAYPYGYFYRPYAYYVGPYASYYYPRPYAY